jgi:hypothetical protein
MVFAVRAIGQGVAVRLAKAQIKSRLVAKALQRVRIIRFEFLQSVS